MGSPRHPRPDWRRGSRHERRTVLFAALLQAIALRASGDFRAPVRLSEEGQEVSNFHAGVDFFGNLTVAYEDRGEIFVVVRAGDAAFSTRVGSGKEPSIALNSIGLFLAYSAATQAEGESRIFLVSRLGSQWSQPEPFSDGPGDDRAPSLALSKYQTPAVAWERRAASAPTTIWFQRAGSEPIRLGEGESPVLLFDRAGRAHVLYASGGRILYRFETSSAQPGTFALPKTVTPAAGEVLKFHASLSADQAVHVVYSDGSSVFSTDNSLGPFSVPLELSGDGARNPALAISEGGAKAVVFEKGGDVDLVLGTSFYLPDPATVARSEELEHSPSCLFDPLGTLTVLFLRQGELYFTTNASIPQARFSAEPTSGEAPLTVRFRDESVGPVTGWKWDFGDGSGSLERNPSHVFSTPGEYTVALSVYGPGGESPVSSRQTIRVFDPGNEMYIGRLRVFPGQKGVHVPVIASHKHPAQGFTIVATYDPNVLEVREALFAKTNLDSIQPELFAAVISDDPEDPYVVIGILFDLEPPYDGRVLPPGRDHRIADIVVDVKPSAAPGSYTRVVLKNQLGRPPLNNIFTVNGSSVLPVLRPSGEIEIARLRFPPPRFFLRGDTNGDRIVNLTDAIGTLNYLFNGKQEPDCFDAADANDDGALDIADAIFALNFLFLSGACPQAPYPDAGLDPTSDELPPCLLR